MNIVASVFGILSLLTSTAYITEIAHYGGWNKPCIHQDNIPKKQRYKIYFCFSLLILIVCSAKIMTWIWPELQTLVACCASLSMFGLLFAILHSKFLPKQQKELIKEIPKLKN